MDENQKQEPQAAQVGEPLDLEGLIALVEARVVESLTRAMERIAAQNEARGRDKDGG